MRAGSPGTPASHADGGSAWGREGGAAFARHISVDSCIHRPLAGIHPSGGEGGRRQNARSRERSSCWVELAFRACVLEMQESAVLWPRILRLCVKPETTCASTCPEPGLVELEAPAGYLKAAGVAFVAENPKLEPDAGFVRQVQMTDKRVPVQSDPSGMLVCASDAPFGLVVAGGAFAAAALMLAAALRQRLPQRVGSAFASPCPFRGGV